MRKFFNWFWHIVICRHKLGDRKIKNGITYLFVKSSNKVHKNAMVTKNDLYI